MTVQTPDKHGNVVAEEGCTRCACGCKYWENDLCVDCGSSPVIVSDFDHLFDIFKTDLEHNMAGNKTIEDLKHRNWTRCDYPADQVGECVAHTDCSRPGRWTHSNVTGNYCAQHAN